MNEAGAIVSPRIRVLIVEDHALVAEGLALTLERAGDIEVVGVARTARDAEALAVAHAPNVLLVDIHLPDGTGIEVASRVRRSLPAAAIVMLSGDESEEALAAAVEAGACGYLTKSVPGSTVIDAVRRAATGEILFPAETLRNVFALSRATAERRARRPSLTAREAEVLQLMAEGLDNKTIAHRLEIGLNTVRHHTQSILEKLEAHSKLEAVARAHNQGILHR